MVDLIRGPVQGSEEWFLQKVGQLSGSKIIAIMGGPKSKQRASLMHDLAVERLTGKNLEFRPTADIRRGIEKEPQARSWYESEVGDLVEEYGFIKHPTIKGLGVSPDGIRKTKTGKRKRRGLEIKCPKTQTHLFYKLANTFNPEYQFQMDLQIACCGLDGVDWVSYDDRLADPSMHGFIIPYERDEARIAAIEKESLQFLAELDEYVKSIKRSFKNGNN